MKNYSRNRELEWTKRFVGLIPKIGKPLAALIGMMQEGESRLTEDDVRRIAEEVMVRERIRRFNNDAKNIELQMNDYARQKKNHPDSPHLPASVMDISTLCDSLKNSLLLIEDNNEERDIDRAPYGLLPCLMRLVVIHFAVLAELREYAGSEGGVSPTGTIPEGAQRRIDWELGLFEEREVQRYSTALRELLPKVWEDRKNQVQKRHRSVKRVLDGAGQTYTFHYYWFEDLVTGMVFPEVRFGKDRNELYGNYLKRLERQTKSDLDRRLTLVIANLAPLASPSPEREFWEDFKRVAEETTVDKLYDKNILLPGQSLRTANWGEFGSFMRSPGKRRTLTLEPSGNLCLRNENGRRVWASGSLSDQGNGGWPDTLYGEVLCGMQGDGNLVTYHGSRQGNGVIWASNTATGPPDPDYKAILEDDGFSIQDARGKKIWWAEERALQWVDELELVKNGLTVQLYNDHDGTSKNDPWLDGNPNNGNVKFDGNYDRSGTHWTIEVIPNGDREPKVRFKCGGSGARKYLAAGENRSTLLENEENPACHWLLEPDGRAEDDSLKFRLRLDDGNVSRYYRRHGHVVDANPYGQGAIWRLFSRNL